LVTLFSLQDRKGLQYGTCLLLKEDGDLVQHVPVLKEVLLADANEVLINQSSSFKNYTSDDHNITAFIEVIKPPVSIIIDWRRK
jgi:hypothetical protein